MKKILIAGAGGAPSEGVIQSLLRSEKKEIILGMGSEPYDLIMSAANKKLYIPYSDTSDYENKLLRLLEREKPDLVHFQNDLEIFIASKFRDKIHALGVKTFMPSHDVIDTCVHKYKSYLRFKEANIIVPENRILNNEEDLKNAFSELADKAGKIWLRSSSIGGGGKGALPTNNFAFAKNWIERFNGWGDFVAAEMLTPESVTWLSIWHEGELVVAQTRKRNGWTHGNRTLSGITGVTKVGQTYSDEDVTRIALKAVNAVDSKPNGIFGVDMTYDKNGVPNPTEINISRFFTTVLFFTEAGLNMPVIFKDLALYGEFPENKGVINPLPNGLLWCRGMDSKPRLIKEVDLENEITYHL